MENLYGFKEKDVLGLSEVLKERKNRPLSAVFLEYAKISGKEKGTVRNLYYAMAKRSKEDESFRKKYFNGKAIKVERGKAFSKQETEEVIKNILLKKEEGKSVRRAVSELSHGNMKLALRLQNKYRAVLRENREKEYGDEVTGAESKGSIERKIKREINALVDRIAESVRKENEMLKQKLIKLQNANSSGEKK